MEKNTKILAAILGLQLLIALFVYTQPGRQGVFEGEEALITAELETADKLVIVDSDASSLEIIKKVGTDQWSLPANDEFPASGDKVARFIESLRKFKRSWPVGKTQISAKQFEVAASKFERKIVFYRGSDVLTTVYLGSSPSFRKIHVRLDGEDLVYSMQFNAHDAPTTARNWFDKEVYKVAKADAQEIVFDSIRFVKDGEEFKVSDLDAGEKMKPYAMNDLLASALNPEFEDVLGRSDPGYENQVFAYTVKSANGEVSFRFFSDELDSEPKAAKATEKKEAEVKGSDHFVLKVSSSPYWYKVRKARLDGLMNIKRSELVGSKGSDENSATDLSEDEQEKEAALDLTHLSTEQTSHQHQHQGQDG